MVKADLKGQAAAAGRVVVVLGTGGTIAGRLLQGDERRYRAAQIGVAELVDAVGGVDLPAGEVDAAGAPRVEARQIAQLDSKDMGWPVWQALVGAIVEESRRPEVAGFVITHGTDTLEETGALLHALLPADVPPVVLTAAMRPADSSEADGPANLAHALVAVVRASQAGRHGVACMLQGRLWAARDVRKVHTTALDAFDGAGRPPLALCGASARWHDEAAWPTPLGWWSAALAQRQTLPRVIVLTSHADVDADWLDALVGWRDGRGQGIAGAVLACTGHGTAHQAWVDALGPAREAGWTVVRASRVNRGGVMADTGQAWPAAGIFTPAQARVLLSLMLATARAIDFTALQAPAA